VLSLGPLTIGDHVLVLDFDFDPPVGGMKSYSCSETVTIQRPVRLVPSIALNGGGAPSKCLFVPLP
jgi:hypothetical protein